MSVSLTKNTLLLIGLQFFSKFLSAIWTFYLARHLGAEGYGLWANVMSVAAILSTLQDMGTSLIFIREVGRDKSLASRHLGTTLILYPIFSVLFVTLTLGAGWLLGFDSGKMWLLVFAALSFAALVPSLASQVILVSHEDFKPYVVATFWGTFSYLGLGIVLIYLKFHVLGVFLAMCFGNAVSSVFILRATVTKYVKPLFVFEPREWWRHTVGGIPLLLNAMVYEAAIRTDRILIEKFWSAGAVGLYQAAFTLTQLFREVILLPAMNSFYPRMTATYHSEPDVFKRLFEKMNILMVLASVPICVFSTVFASEIIRILYGSAFAPAVPLFAVSIWMVPFVFISVLWSYVLVVQDRQSVILWARTAAFAFNFTMNWYLLPRFGVIASSAVAVLSQMLILIVHFVVLRKTAHFDFIPRCLGIVAAGFAGGGVAFFLKGAIANRWLGAAAALFAGLLIYSTAIYFLKVLKKEEVEWLESQISFLKSNLEAYLPF